VRGAGLREPEAKVKDAYSLRVWLDGQSTEVAITIAARAALRTLPLAVRSARKRPNVEEAGKFAASTIVSFRAGAIAHVVAKYPARASEFRELAAAAPGAIATAFPAAQASAAAVLTLASRPPLVAAAMLRFAPSLMPSILPLRLCIGRRCRRHWRFRCPIGCLGGGSLRYRGVPKPRRERVGRAAAMVPRRT